MFLKIFWHRHWTQGRLCQIYSSISVSIYKDRACVLCEIEIRVWNECFCTIDLHKYTQFRKFNRNFPVLKDLSVFIHLWTQHYLPPSVDIILHLNHWWWQKLCLHLKSCKIVECCRKLHHHESGWPSFIEKKKNCLYHLPFKQFKINFGLNLLCLDTLTF